MNMILHIGQFSYQKELNYIFLRKKDHLGLLKQTCIFSSTTSTRLMEPLGQSCGSLLAVVDNNSFPCQ